MKVFYLKSGYRQPVQAHAPVYLRDIQQDIPAGWCPICEQMLYSAEKRLCRRCEEAQEYEQDECESLPDLHTGGKALRL